MDQNLDYIFHRKLFTRVFWDLKKASTRYVINYGGASASKSWSQAQYEIIKLLEGTKDTLVLRKTGADLQDSVYEQLKIIIVRWGMREDFTYPFSGSKREIRHIETNRRFIFRGLDDKEKLKSIVGIARIWLEEFDQFDFDDFKEINRRARGIENIQITGTFNPIIETHWIKTHFFDTPEIRDKTTFIHSTYKDNLKFLTKDDIDNLEQYKLYDINEYNVFALGQWGKPGVKRPFAFAFRDEHITSGLTFDGREIVYLSFDFNVDPITCIGSQHLGTKIRVIKEFRLANSNIYELCREIRDYFHGTIYFKITGDASGSNRTAITQKAVNYYTVIKSELRLTNRQFDVPRANPSVKNTRVLVNTLLMRADVLINDTCRYLIDDLRYVEVKENGEVDKIKAERDGMNHLLDCLRYYCFTYHNRFLKHAPHKTKNTNYEK